MKEPTNEELKKLTMELFELLLDYKRGHDGRVESLDYSGCDCFACTALVELLEALDGCNKSALHHIVEPGEDRFYSRRTNRS